MNVIQAYFDENFYDLDEAKILEIAKHKNDPIINNVIVGRHEHCYSIWLIDDQNTIDYQLFYLNGSGQELKGHLIKMDLHNDYRHEILFAFSRHLAEAYTLDILAVHNTFQEKTSTIAEQIGFMSFDPIELRKITDDPSPIMMAKGIRGFIQTPILKHLDIYQFIFGTLPIIQSETGKNFIYLMHNGRTNLVKIGKSKKPVFREKTLQGEDPDVTLIAVWHAQDRVERTLHKKYQHARTRGEWFKLSFQDMKEIKQFMDQQAETIS
jgi:hypothetical protein